MIHFVYNGIVFTNLNGTNNCIVGTNSTTQNNAIDSSSFSQTSILIPSKVNSFNVIEVGQYSFYIIPSIRQITVEEGIRQINRYAFYGLVNLEIVILPLTAEFLGNYSISSVIWTNGSSSTSSGTLTVIFKPNSKLYDLGSGAIERKSNIIVYYCGYGTPQFESRPFYRAEKVLIYSFHDFLMNGYRTVVDNSLCPMLQKLKYQTFVSKKYSTPHILCFLFLQYSFKN